MNLINVVNEFLREEDCLAYLEKMRWPDGVRCVKCESDKIGRVTSRGKTKKPRYLYQCRSCRKQFTAKSGTIFHDSHLPLRTWFMAVALMLDAKKSVSANQLKRHLHVRYDTAWHLAHRIRKAMVQDTSKQLSGITEVDETFVGGRYDKRRKRDRWDKQLVVGLAERGGNVEAKPIKSRSKEVLTGIVRDRVSMEATMICTDELPSYQSLGSDYKHETVNHIKLEYVRAGNVHVNTIENFWSLFKRGVIGQFHKVSIKHLPRYLDEFTYRLNNRKDADLFSTTLKNLAGGKALPYKLLVADGGTSNGPAGV